MAAALFLGRQPRKERTELKNTAAIPSGRENNFPIVRLTAAIFVFIGHMGDITGSFTPLVSGNPIHEIGVGMLFLMSGYLITKSWLSDPHPLRYLVRRFLRLWPPFAVMILLMVYVAGPLLSSYGIEGYFHHREFGLYLTNLRLLIAYTLPGVFEHLPVTDSINGGLWTMPVEAGFYILTPIFLTVLRLTDKIGQKSPKTHKDTGNTRTSGTVRPAGNVRPADAPHGERSFWIVAFLTIAAIAFDFYLRACHAGGRLVFYRTELISAFHLGVFYLIGILFTYERVRKLLNIQVACVLMCLMFFSQVSAPPYQYLAMYLVFPYFVMSFVFIPNPRFYAVGRKLELSYGIYLYGFFFQQLALYFRGLNSWPLNYFQLLVVSAIPTVLAAALSYYLVEKPVMRFSRWLLEKLTPKSKQTAGK